jgi:alpha-1,2-glucosyltransferase
MLALNKKKYNIESAIETLSIAVLPPMYFFVHLYYTDILSLTTVLGMFLLALKKRHNFATVFGFLSILMRQTNVVWVAMVFGSNLIDQIIVKILPRTKAVDVSKMV